MNVVAYTAVFDSTLSNVLLDQGKHISYNFITSRENRLGENAESNKYGP